MITIGLPLAAVGGLDLAAVLPQERGQHDTAGGDMADHFTQSEPRPVETFDMRANFEGLIQLLATNLYAEPDVFVRELIQNAHDGIRLRQDLAPGLEGRIDIEVRPAAAEIVFRDNGLGMDREDIREFLSVIGSTGTGTARQRLEEGNRLMAFALIGQFGIGMLSAFVVARRVTVRTRKVGADRAFVWENQGRAECILRPGDRSDPGTEIVVSVGPGHTYMLDPDRIRAAVVRYCDFLPIPVYLDGRGPVNLLHAPWDVKGWPSEEVREAAYRDFVHHRYPDVALEVIPVEIEEPVRARGALYISDRRLPDLNTTGVVDIFVRRMFVRGGDAELLPPWAKFVRGVIESPDLQPTAARDNVRRDGWAYTALRERLGELIVERLTHLARHQPERFREINRWHQYHLNGMALFHEDFFAAVGDLLLFETNRGLLPLEEIFNTDAGEVYYFTSSGAAPQFFGMADARGRVVVKAGEIFEKEILQKYARTRAAGRRLSNLDAGQEGTLFEPPKTAASACSRVEAEVEGALAGIGLANVSAQVCRFVPDSLPAVVLLPPDTEAGLRLEALVQQPWFLDSLGDIAREVLHQRDHRPVRLHLNEAHPLIAALLEDGQENAHDPDVLVGLFLAAALNARDLLTEETVRAVQPRLASLLARCAAMA